MLRKRSWYFKVFTWRTRSAGNPTSLVIQFLKSWKAPHKAVGKHLCDGDFILYYWVPNSISPVEYVKLARIIPTTVYIPSRNDTSNMNATHLA
jgi:hypothetical protein